MGVVKPVRGWAVVIVAMLFAGLIATLPPAEAAISTAGSLSATPAQGIAGEALKLRGKLPPQRSRPVVLQRRSDTSWVSVASGKTTSTGLFAFATKFRTTSTTYRVFAPRVSLGGKTYDAVVTPTRTVKTQAQSGTLSLVTTAETGQGISSTATFSPIRFGRPVVFQVMTAGSWAQAATTTESSTGRAIFAVPTQAAGSFTYRAVAQPYHGAAAVAAPSRTIQISDPAPTDTTPPPVPSGLAATAGDGLVSVSWDPVTADDLAGYLVYRATSATGPWMQLTSQPTLAPDFVAAGLSNGTEYWFTVASVDLAGNGSPNATAVAATPVEATPAPGEHCGQLQSSETWTSARTHRITCAVLIPSGVTLIITAGAVVKFDPGTGLQVQGALDATGTAADPVVFTTITDDTAGGDTNGDGNSTTPTAGTWSSSTAAGSEFALSHVEVRYAGLYGAGSTSITDSRVDGRVHLNNRGPFVVDGNQLGAGVSVLQNYGAREVTVTNNTVTGGNPQPNDPGIDVSVPNRENSLAPTVSGNTVSGATGAAIQISAMHLLPAQLVGNTGSNNTLNGLVLSGLLEGDLTLPRPGLPIVLGNDTDGVDNSYLTVSQGTTLTLNPGAVLKAIVGGYWSGLQVQGSLVAAGTAADPVVLTTITDDTAGGDLNGDGNTTTPTAGAWHIYMDHASELQLSHVEVRYLEYLTSQWVGSASITDSRVDGHVSLHGHGPFVLDGNRFGGPVDVGQGEGAREVTVTNNTVTRGPLAPGVGILVGLPDIDSLAPTVSGNTVTGATGAAILVIAAHLLPAQLVGNTGSDNTLNGLVLSGHLEGDLTLPRPGLPIVLGNDTEGHFGYDGLVVGQGATLTLNPGAVLKALGPRDCGCGGLQVQGALVAAGTATDPVVLTSITDDTVGGDLNGDGNATSPVAGDWEGINATGTDTAPGTVQLDGVDIRFAATALDVGANAYAAIHGRLADSSVGVASGGMYVDATDVDWGSPEGPASGAITGAGVQYVPWVGYVAPPRPAPAPQQPVPSENGSQCPQFVAFGLRGSKEEPKGDWNLLTGWTYPTFRNESDGFGDNNSKIVNAFENYQGTTVKKVAIQYRALPVPVVDMRVTPQLYNDSIFDGVDKLTARLQREAQDCPGSKFLIVGYSQGALAAHIAVRMIDSALRDRIAAVAFVADPGRWAGGHEETNSSASYTDGQLTVQPLGTMEALSSGVWAAGNLWDHDVSGPLPEALADRAFALCHNRDMVCAAYIGAWWGPHLDYTGTELGALGYQLASYVP